LILAVAFCGNQRMPPVAMWLFAHPQLLADLAHENARFHLAKPYTTCSSKNVDRFIEAAPFAPDR
jgi:hypothetical protein